MSLAFRDRKEAEKKEIEKTEQERLFEILDSGNREAALQAARRYIAREEAEQKGTIE